MRIIGKITKVLPIEKGTSRQGAEWRKQTIVVREDGATTAYPDELALDLFNDKIPATLTEGQVVDVLFGTSAREYNGRLYNDLYVVKIK